ncbi:nicotinamide-nucleotide amidase [Methylorubrum rhodinum]|uniref:Nicotinamide-nucleotide amidase n=1 Tax=Methylorubrum rhodinum TaxID=29428 RepID=A0A840ZDV8_9HYPH|nr:CinA family protein [Methylorubrum rhodinum]MBB5755385.1 nicotinamide-nucleotide amidase [Methylorubrum rhodinum]
MIEDAALLARAEALVRAYAASGRRIATAESCTGGLVAGLLTAVPGSSAVVDRGFVTYSNAAKADLVGVPMDLIDTHGAVSEPVARAMAEGALARSLADAAVSITGIAGPGGGSADKPVGLVHFALAAKDAPTRHVERRFGDPGRAEIRLLSVEQAVALLQDAVET